MGQIACRLEILGEYFELCAQAQGLVLLNVPPLHSHLPGQPPSQERRPARGAGGVHVVIGENDAGPPDLENYLIIFSTAPSLPCMLSEVYCQGVRVVPRHIVPAYELETL